MPKPTLQKLGADDNIEHFLSTFERIAKQQVWPRETWATQLAGLLTGKAMAAYAAVGTEDAADYEKVKTAILHVRYEVNEETHRQRFRQDRKKPEESYRAWICRTADNFDRWMQGQTMSVREVVIAEQILQKVSEEMSIWLKERKIESLEELGKLADDYVLARKSESMRPGKPILSGHKQDPKEGRSGIERHTRVTEVCKEVDVPNKVGVRKLTVRVIGSVTYVGSGGI